MKKFIVTSVLVLSVALGAFAQQIVSNNGVGYEIRPKYKRPIQKETLEQARSLEDIIPDYPRNWINDYASVEVLATGHNKSLKASGKNATLNAEQKNVLQTAGLADDVEINVNYRTQNLVTGAPTNGGMHVVFTVVPETEAEFVGGDEALDNYFKKESIDKISKKIPAAFMVVVRFWVNEQGKVTDVVLSESSGNAKIDKLLLDAITQMPNWKPAQNAQGTRVKQEFEFRAGKIMGGC